MAYSWPARAELMCGHDNSQLAWPPTPLNTLPKRKLPVGGQFGPREIAKSMFWQIGPIKWPLQTIKGNFNYFSIVAHTWIGLPSNFCVIVKIFEFYSLINCPLPLGLNAIFIQPVLCAHKLLEDFPDLYFDPTKTLHRPASTLGRFSFD